LKEIDLSLHLSLPGSLMNSAMRQLTIERAAAIILFALLFALATRIPTDTDTWWHIRSGQYMLSNGIIYADPFSFTKAGEPWINHSWGSQIILYAVWQLAGNTGLAIYTATLATIGMWFVYRICSGNVYLRAFAIVVGAATAAVFWSPRPQMISFLLSTVVLYLLHMHKRQKIDRLWYIPVIMGLWGNLHAGFSIGFILLLGSIAGEILGHIFNPQGEHIVSWAGVRKLVLVTVISIGAIVVNPYGFQMLAVPFQTIGIGALQNFIQEWNSPNFHERQTWPFIFLLFSLLGAVGASKKRLNWTDYMLCTGTAFMGLLAGRNIAVFAVVATPVLTYHLNDVLTERGWIVRSAKQVTPRMARMNALLVGLVVLGALLKVLLVLNPTLVNAEQRKILPIDAVTHLKSASLSGPIFNSYNWGGYLIFALPDMPIFVDGRTDLYGDEFLTQDYRKIATGESGWQTGLDRFGVNLVIMEKDSGLAQSLSATSGWKLDYEDDLAVVYTRESVSDG
jgi:hypothetical protein